MASFKFDKIEGLSGAEEHDPKGTKLKIELGTNLPLSQEAAMPEGRPSAINVTLTRQVKIPGEKPDENRKKIDIGDLVFYRVALQSTKKNWNVERDKKDKWPILTLEFHTQTEDVRLKAELTRLLVDNWSLEIETNNDGEIASISETLDLRAWVWTLSKASGNPLKITLADSA